MKAEITSKLLDQLRPGLEPQIIEKDGRVSLTKMSPGLRDYIIYDERTPGFGVRVSGTFGSAVFSIAFLAIAKMGTSATRKLVVGSYKNEGTSDLRLAGRGDLLTVADARKKAQAWRGLMLQGIDPRNERRDRRNATARLDREDKEDVRWMLDLWHADDATADAGQPASTLADRALVKRWLVGHAKAKDGAAPFPLLSQPFRLLSLEMVEDTLTPLFKAALPPVEVDGVVRKPAPQPKWGPQRLSMSSAWKIYNGLAAAWGNAATLKQHHGPNPFKEWLRQSKKKHKWPKPKARTTQLELDNEAGRVWLRRLSDLIEDTDDTMATLAVYLVCVLLWGTRRTETARLQWGDVDFTRGVVVVRPETRKVQKNHALVLTPWAKALLEGHRKRNEKRSLPVDAQAWVFSSSRQSKAQVLAGAASTKDDDSWRPTRIANIDGVLDALEEASGQRLTPHDLRRTIASYVFGETLNPQTVAMALGHSDGKSVTTDYIQSKLAALRPMMVQRERKLMEAMGRRALESGAPLALSADQKKMLASIKTMLMSSCGLTFSQAAQLEG